MLYRMGQKFTSVGNLILLFQDGNVSQSAKTVQYPQQDEDISLQKLDRGYM